MPRYAMVIDLRTCLGCQACVAACTQENETPFWNNDFRTTVRELSWGNYPTLRKVFYSQLCMHCENPPCQEACPTGATYRSEEGVVLIDYEKCAGCRACEIACPYGARYFYDESEVRRAKDLYGSTNQHPAPHVDKCNFCYPRLKRGDLPACVATCPGESRSFGDLDDPHSPVNQILAREKTFHVEGTSIYYILEPDQPILPIPRAALAPGSVRLWKKEQPLAKLLMGATAAASLVSLVSTSLLEKGHAGPPETPEGEEPPTEKDGAGKA